MAPVYKRQKWICLVAKIRLDSRQCGIGHAWSNTVILWTRWIVACAASELNSDAAQARWIAAGLFELGPVCWHELFMAKAKYDIKQHDLWLLFKLTDSGMFSIHLPLQNMQHNFEIIFLHNFFYWPFNLCGTQTTDNVPKPACNLGFRIPLFCHLTASQVKSSQ